MNNLTSREKALAMLFEKWCPKMEAETVPVAKALGRVVAEEYRALHSIPVVRASAMDGVAVDSARFADGIPDMSQWTPGRDYVRADTGDDFDDSFDAVIRIEDVTILSKGGLKLKEGIEVRPGMNVSRGGSSFRKGTKLNDAYITLRPADLASLAMGGISDVAVVKKPRIAFIPTGSELIPVGAPLRRGCNYDTNSLMVSLSLEEMGAEALRYPIVADKPRELRNALMTALDDADVVIINGGSSKGSEDFNTRLLAKEGEMLFHGVSAVPGRPLSIALIGGKPVINMAGPAAAAFYTLEWCIRPIVCRMLGVPVPQKRRLKGVLTGNLRGSAPMDMLCRLEVRRTEQGYSLTPLERGKDDLPAILRSNAMYISPIGDRDHMAGEELEVELLRDISEIPYE